MGAEQAERLPHHEHVRVVLIVGVDHDHVRAASGERSSAEARPVLLAPFVRRLALGFAGSRSRADTGAAVAAAVGADGVPRAPAIAQASSPTAATASEAPVCVNAPCPSDAETRDPPGGCAPAEPGSVEERCCGPPVSQLINGSRWRAPSLNRGAERIWRSARSASLGCGLMGHGISQICAQAGWDVVVREIDQAALDKGMGKIEKQLGRAVEKGKIEQSDADAVQRRGSRRPSTTPNLADSRPRDRGDHRGPRRQAGDVARGRRHRQGRRLLGHQHLVAPGADAGRRDQARRADHRPALLQPRPGDAAARGGARGEDERRRRSTLGFEVGEKLGKTTVAAGDNRGFIVNRLLVPYMLDAIRAHEQGVGLDRGHRHRDDGRREPPDGPADACRLRRARHAGRDRGGDGRCLRRGPLRRARDACRKMVDAGDFGRKSGQGFYDYSGDKPVPVDSGS